MTHQNFPQAQPNEFIDHATGEVTQHPPQRTSNQSYGGYPRAANINPALRESKTSRQVEMILNHILNPQSHGVATAVFFCENSLGTKYMVTGFECTPFESEKMQAKLMKYAISRLNLKDVSTTVIKNCMTVLAESPEYWNKTASNHYSPQIRVFNGGYPYIYYFAQRNQPIPLIRCGTAYPGIKAMLFPESAIEIFDPELQNNAQNYQVLEGFAHNPMAYSKNIWALMDTLQIQDHQKLIVLTWLVHALVSPNFMLLELMQTEVAHVNAVVQVMKAVLDPSNEGVYPVPKKALDVQKLGLSHYLIAMKSSSAKHLTEDHQSSLLELMTSEGVMIDLVSEKRGKSQALVKRPIILAVPDTIISCPELRKRTISLPVSDVENAAPSMDIDPFIIQRARLEMIQTAILTSHVLSPESLKQPYFDKNRFKTFESYLRIGCEISHLFFRDSGTKFLKDFEQWATEDLFVQIEDSDMAYALYQWAKEHTDSNHTYTASDWIGELRHYALMTGFSIDTYSPRKVGSVFKQIAPIFLKIGIQIISGGRSRYSNWTISVSKDVGLNDAIKLHERFKPNPEGANHARHDDVTL